MEFWVTQAFNGISYGALLFLLAGGLSLIFGMMRIVNMTHGSYYLLGGYVALTIIWRTGYFVLAILAATGLAGHAWSQAQPDPEGLMKAQREALDDALVCPVW